MKSTKLFLACAIDIGDCTRRSGFTRRCRPTFPTSSRAQSPSRWNTSRSTARHLKEISKATPSIAMSSSFLPPSYEKDKKRRYPVVYALHGYSIGAEQWTHEIHVPQTIEGAFAQGAQEMIVVLPDSKTIYNGSMYSSSATTGDFEKFICARCCLLHRRALPHHPGSHEPRTGRSLHGRLWCVAHRHEAS